MLAWVFKVSRSWNRGSILKGNNTPDVEKLTKMSFVLTNMTENKQPV